MKNAWRSSSAGAALIILLTVVAYWPALHGEFVFDDYVLITENRLIKASDGLYRFWMTVDATDYYPLTWSLWWLEWRLWGTNATGYHVVNVLLHGVDAVLGWMILRRLKVPGAWLAAMVFAIHPVNVATAGWISEQKSTLSMLFYALSILLYLRFDEDNRSPRPSVPGWPWYGFSLVAFLLALLTKTAVVMLPVVLLACIWWRHGRVRWKDWLSSVPFFVLSLVLGLVTVWFQYHRALEGHVIRTEGFAGRLAAAGWVPWFYLSKAFLPVNLTMIYPKWNIHASHWISYLPGLALVGCLMLFWWKRETWGRPCLFGLGYFVVTLFPVMGFFDQNFYLYSLVADHWQYYSIIGAIAFVVSGGVVICRRMGERGRALGALASVVVLTVLGAATWNRSRVYADSETFWQDNVQKNPEAWIAHYNLGNTLSEAGRTEEAIHQYEEVLRINPGYAEAHNNLGNALLRVGRIQEAIGHCEQALRIKPDNAEAHNNLGNALFETGDVNGAIGHYEQALRIKPDLAVVHYNLGNVLFQGGKVEDAIRHYEEAVRINPGYAEAHNNLGNALLRVGRIQEAIGQCEQALRIKPDNAEAHNNLGNALSEAGDIEGAIGHYGQALRIRPDYAEVHYNLGAVLEQAGRVPEAIGHYEQALRIDPNMAEAQNKLARLRGAQ